MSTVPTPDDVFRGVRAKIAAAGDFAAQLPGGAWFGRQPKGQPAGAYLVGRVEEKEPDYEDSAGTYLQSFVVELSIWVASDDAGAPPTNAARAWLDALLGWTPADPAGGVSVPNAVATIHVRPVGGQLKLAEDLKKGQDVMAAGKRVEVRVQGLRS